MADETSTNTASNTTKKTRGVPFKKGDPRINRKGRPVSFDALRELAQQIAHEVATMGGKPVVIAGHAVTNAEMVMRQWLQSGKPELQKGFIEIAFGKVPTPIEIRDWREAAKQSGLDPDKVLNEFEDIIASAMGAGTNGSGGDAESNRAEAGADVDASPSSDAAAG